MALNDLQGSHPARPPWGRFLERKDLLAGLMFMAIGVLGLWVSRDYPIGTALRMSTGYVPRLLCWVLLLIGAGLALFNLGERRAAPGLGAGPEQAQGDESVLRPLVFVVGSLVAFGLTIERLGLVIATLLLVGIGALASRGLRPLETLIAGVVLAAIAVGIFIIGLGITIPIWPDL
jgi:hypothetical protein